MADAQKEPLPHLSKKRCGTFGHFAHRLTRQRSQPEWAETLALLQSTSARGSVARSFRRAIERGPTEGREPPKSFVSFFVHTYARLTATNAGRKVLCEVGFPASRMGFVEKMPQGLPARCVQGPRRSLRGQSARRPGRDAFRLRGTSVAVDQAGSASTVFHANSVPCRQMAWRTTASLRATAMEARFQPMRFASRSAHSFNGHDRRTRVMSTPAAS